VRSSDDPNSGRARVLQSNKMNVQKQDCNLEARVQQAQQNAVIRLTAPKALPNAAIRNEAKAVSEKHMLC